jgi:hypothetical protein
MEEPSDPGGGGGHGVGSGVADYASGGGGTYGDIGIDDLDELWLSRHSTVTAAMFARKFVPRGVIWNLGLGIRGFFPHCFLSLILHFGTSEFIWMAWTNDERTLACDDITMMNMVSAD